MNKIWNSAPLELSFGLFVLRVSSGLLMAVNHGWGKVGRFMSGEEIKFYNFGGLGPQASLGLAAFAEFVCALLLVLGLFHRVAVVPLIITMAVAAFAAHAGDPLKDRESSLMFLAVFVALLLTGPGKYSLDALRDRAMKDDLVD